MSKRNGERREAKGAGRKRRTTRDLPARKSLRVTGGLLPAVKPSQRLGGHVKVFDGSTGAEIRL
jgi:hypothetical protein